MPYWEEEDDPTNSWSQLFPHIQDSGDGWDQDEWGTFMWGNKTAPED